MPGWQQAYIIPRKSFLATEDADSKRLHRTNEYFRKTRIRPQIPTQQEIISRTNAVLNSIYLMFNEGYNATHTEKLIREDLISQTMLLCKALIENEKTRLPEIYALMALMCLHSSRNEDRLTSEDELIPLNKQDRSTWNRELISMGNDYLNKSAFGKNPYTLPF